MRYGFTGFLKQNVPSSQPKQQFFKYKAARVSSIVLDDTHPRFKELGEWNGIGTIEFSLVDEQINEGGNSIGIARPLNPSIKDYPLKNEIVVLMFASNRAIGDNIFGQELYYISVLNLWNHPHHNAYPVYNVSNVNLGLTFKESNKINPLLSFEGDRIFEGRFGNSIRLGSTVKNDKNNWSSTGDEGDPLTIIRNGQGENIPNGYLPIVEDINKDISSVYLTSTQNIPLTPSSENYNSYTSPPETISKYKSKQILINSGRLVFNSNEDHILLSSKKSINLNAVQSINFDTKNMVLDSDKIYIGSKNSNEPLLLGNKTSDLIKELINTLIDFMKISSQLTTPGAVPTLVPISIAVNTKLNILLSQLESIKSKTNYTE